MDWKPYLSILNFADYAEIYAEESTGLAISFEDGKVDEIESGESSGMALRYLQDEETRFGSVNGWDAKLLFALSKNLREGLKTDALTASDPPLSRGAHRHPVQKDPGAVPLEEKIRILSACDAAAKTVPENQFLRQISISYGERVKKISCIFREDHIFQCFEEERCYTLFAVTAVAAKDGILQTATEVASALCGYELFEKIVPQQIAQIAAKRAIAKIFAPPAPTGEMPVILEAQAGGTMIHEAIGHSLEADSIQKGISPVYAGKIGATVANEKISVYDDPTLAGHRGSFAFDDEGTPAEKTLLVERGTLKNFLYDRLTAKKEQRKSNGHGRRESYGHPPIPRMSNTFIAPGPDEPEKILNSVEKGLLVRRMGGGQVNPVNGDFVFEVEEGYLLEGGKIKSRVRGASLLGNGPEVLKSIDLVGKDMGWGVGTCGKDGQGVPVSDGQPTLRIPKLVIGGTQG